jgi:hypothetical protein
VVATLTVALSWLGVRRTCALVRRWAPGSAGPGPSSDERLFRARRVAWIVRGVSRRVPGTRCLVRSLATLAMLRREGLAADLRLGVRRSREGIEAHAWVEVEGDALGEPEPLEPFATFDAAGVRDSLFAAR